MFLLFHMKLNLNSMNWTMLRQTTPLRFDWRTRTTGCNRRQTYSSRGPEKSHRRGMNIHEAASRPIPGCRHACHGTISHWSASPDSAHSPNSDKPADIIYSKYQKIHIIVLPACFWRWKLAYLDERRHQNSPQSYYLQYCHTTLVIPLQWKVRNLSIIEW